MGSVNNMSASPTGRGAINHPIHAKFIANGLHVEKALLTPTEVERLFTVLNRQSGAPPYKHGLALPTHKWDCEHAISLDPVYWWLLSHPRLGAVLRQLLGGEELVYAERSQSKVWIACASTGAHRDCIEQRFGEGVEWDESTEPYRIANIAIYLQPVIEGFQWGAIPGSHRHEQRLKGLERWFWRLRPGAGRMASRLPGLPIEAGRLPIRIVPTAWPFAAPAEEIWITPQPGDCIFFDPRLIHAGGPVHGWKFALFYSIGLPSRHTTRHAQYFGPDRTVHESCYQGLANALRSSGIRLISEEEAGS